jgi:voltage-gated potassium channel
MTFREKVHYIIFKHDTPGSQAFDITLIGAILLSVLTVALESIPALRQNYPNFFFITEWIFTGLFTIEYAVRIWSTDHKKRYITSVWGIIDLLAILPSYLGIFLVQYHYLLNVRILRLLRIFRVLRLVNFIKEGRLLVRSMRASFYKIGIFMFFMSIVIFVLGTVMYVVEGEQSGFTSIPESVYWAVVTISTVGYGDISPQTPLGKIIASCIMLLGYTIIAVPTGIATFEVAKEMNKKSENHCGNCGTPNVLDAYYCKECGEPLDTKGPITK